MFTRRSANREAGKLTSPTRSRLGTLDAGQEKAFSTAGGQSRCTNRRKLARGRGAGEAEGRKAEVRGGPSQIGISTAARRQSGCEECKHCQPCELRIRMH